MIVKKGNIGETYCLGGGNEMKNIDITKIILSNLGFGEEMIEFVEDRLGHDFRYAIDFSKAQKNIDWEPQINFEDGLKNTIDWYKNNTDWWKKIINNRS